MSAPLFVVEDLHVSTAGARPADILNGVDLTVNAGEVHAVMGPSGSGKSTLAATILGSPEYTVTRGHLRLSGDDIGDWPTDVRANAGIFLAFQSPREIAGVSLLNFVHQALAQRKGIGLGVLELRSSIMDWMERLDMDTSSADWNLNEGLSDADKKRNEILQMALLEPEVAILDETDTGLEIDARRVVAHGVGKVRESRPDLGILMITQDPGLMTESEPDHVHILMEGRVVASGGPEVATQLAADGYDAFRDAVSA